jgi:hypothetical protein
MKRKTLLSALGVAGALACSAASATTYLCVQDPTDEYYMSCAEITSDALASSPLIEYAPASEPAFVTYLIEPA